MKRIVVLVVDSLIRLASMAPMVHAQEKQESHGCQPRQKKF